MAILVIWSRLDSSADVTSPQKGVGGSVIAPATFVPATYGNGVKSALGGAVKFPLREVGIPDEKDTYANPVWINHVSPFCGTAEFWLTARKSSADLNDVGVIVDFNQGLTYCASWCPTGGLRFAYSGNGNWQAIFRRALNQVIADGYSSFSKDESFHIRVVWDNKKTCGINGKTLVIFKNGVEVGSAADGWGGVADNGGVNPDLFLGNRKELSENLPEDIIIDDFKIYRGCNLGPPEPPAEKGRPPDNLLCEQKKNPTDVTDPNPEFSAIFHGG